MAGEYGVNIKFRTIGLSQLDKAKAKAKELEASVSSIRSLDLGKAIRGKVGDQVAEATGQIKRYAQQVNKTGKVVGETQQQQEAALQAFKNLRSQVKVGGRDFDILTQAIIKQNKAIDEQNKKLGINQKKRKADPKGRSAALKSGLISGAFPLLFGQGAVGGAAGFAGGFIGTRLGGQMGGFAGGLVATAIVQQLTEAIKGLNELGRALDPFTLNIGKINQSIGLANTPTGEYLKLLEQTQGKQAAFNAAMNEMEQVVGQDGVQALKNFGEGTKQLENIFSRFLTRIAATAAKIIAGAGEEDPASITGLRRSSLLGQAKKRRGEDPELDALFKQLETGSRINDQERKSIQNKIIAKELIQEQNGLLKLQELQFDQITKAVTDKNLFLQDSIKFGRTEATIMQKMREFDLAARLKGIDLSTKEAQARRKLYEDTLRQNLELEKLSKLYQGIATTIETGLVDAIEGAINGTKTLGDVARSVFTQIQRSLIQFGVNAFLGGLPGVGQFFRANGGPVSSGKSYMVGERGPEMFVPNTGGRIVPNSDMGSATNVVVNVDASGSSVEGDEERGRELGQMLSAAIQSELIKQRRPGGLLS
tara:strand:+ start:2327 stop:4105 length:1779 start_codon:yes stop_codon:yes gene_type:complete